MLHQLVVIIVECVQPLKFIKVINNDNPLTMILKNLLINAHIVKNKVECPEDMGIL